MAKKAGEKTTVTKKTTATKLSAASKKIDVKTNVSKEIIKKSKKNLPEIVAPKKIKKTAQKPAVIEAKEEILTISTATKINTKLDKKILIETKPLPEIVQPQKLKTVKSILISQPPPEAGKSPYIDLAQQFKIKIDWRPFTHVEGIKATEFRKQKIYVEQYSCVVFSSKIAIEHYFRLCEELRIKISEDNKYFCNSEAIALYLQKFIQYRKRKVFYGDGRLPKLMVLILKHKESGSFLLPCSDVRDGALAEALQKYDIPYVEAFIYKTVASDLSDLSDVKYDMLVFFNPSAIDSLYSNFPDFSQDETRLAIFGNSTAESVKTHQLNINIFAPTPENPSLVDAIKKYIAASNKKK